MSSPCAQRGGAAPAAAADEVGAVGWLRANLFSSLTNALLTLVGIALVVAMVPPLVRWAVLDAVWTGESRDDCLAPGAGACWAFVKAKFGQFIYGRYPIDERWRVDAAAVLLLVGLIPMADSASSLQAGKPDLLAGGLPGDCLDPAHRRQFRLLRPAIPTLVAVGCLAPV